MTWQPRPVPEVTPETKPYWSAAAEGRLLVRECDSCGFVFHYPREHCPECFADAVLWREATGRGEVYSYSVTHHLDNWPDSELPVVVAYVELKEGPRVMTNVVDADPEAVTVGDPVVVKFEPVDGEDIAVPVFTLH